MGRFDPKTGEFKLVQPAGAPGQQPYALRFLSDGRRPWFSYFGSNKIATVDPDTMEVKESCCRRARPASAAWASPPTT